LPSLSNLAKLPVTFSSLSFTQAVLATFNESSSLSRVLSELYYKVSKTPLGLAIPSIKRPLTSILPIDVFFT
jgi:hypothetical protein